MGQQRNERAKLAADGNTKAWTEAEREPGMDPPAPSAVWVRILPSQVVRAVAVALSTAVVLLGAFFLLWRAPPPNVDARVGPGPRPAALAWAYKTDASGRLRHFFSHREAAWWAIRRVSAPFSPFLASSILWALFASGSPRRWSTALPVVAAPVCVWLAMVGAVYPYLALSGGVMGRAERRRRGVGADAP